MVDWRRALKAAASLLLPAVAPWRILLICMNVSAEVRRRGMEWAKEESRRTTAKSERIRCAKKKKKKKKKSGG
jgi:hypothetical protein